MRAARLPSSSDASTPTLPITATVSPIRGICPLT
jgi:hypothetical protein